MGPLAGHRAARRRPQGPRHARGVRRGDGADDRRARARPRAARRFHAHLHARLHRALPAPHPQHPSLAAARLPGAAHAPAGARRGREAARLHRARGDAGARQRPDRDPGRGAGAGERHRGLACRTRAGAEHRIYRAAVRWFLEGRLQIEGNRVILRGRMRAPQALVYPEEA